MSDRIFNFHDVILMMTLGECFLLALCRVALPSGLRLENFLLSAFLLSIAASTAGTLLIWNEALFYPTYEYASWLSYFSMGSLILRGPALYLYVQALTHSEFQLKRSHILHLLPWLCGLVYIGTFSLQPSELRNIVADGNHFDIVSILWYYVKLISLTYGLASLVVLWRYQEKLKESYSDYPRGESGWLSVLVGGFILIWLWSFGTHYVAKEIGGTSADFFGVMHNYIMFALINALFIYSLAYTHSLFRLDMEKKKTHKDDKLRDFDIALVQKGIDIHKMHLEGSINIEEFSQRISLPTKTVSSVINRHFGTNFYDFINSHRIEAAKSMLGDREKSELTVLEILLASGFNNKSSFHRFFKRIVGVSPTEYRRTMQSGELN